jgi:hypothetical protein
MLEGKRIGDQPHALGQQAGGGRQHAGADAVDRVRHPIVALAAPTVGEQLDGNQHKENGTAYRMKSMTRPDRNPGDRSYV